MPKPRTRQSPTPRKRTMATGSLTHHRLRCLREVRVFHNIKCLGLSSHAGPLLPPQQIVYSRSRNSSVCSISCLTYSAPQCKFELSAVPRPNCNTSTVQVSSKYECISKYICYRVINCRSESRCLSRSTTGWTGPACR